MSMKCDVTDLWRKIREGLRSGYQERYEEVVETLNYAAFFCAILLRMKSYWEKIATQSCLSKNRNAIHWSEVCYTTHTLILPVFYLTIFSFSLWDHLLG